MVTCGNIGVSFEKSYIEIIISIIGLIKIAVPIILVIMGMLDFGKAVTAKGDDINKAYRLFFSRIVSAAIVYFIIPIVQLLTNILVNTGVLDKDDNCIACFTEGKCVEIIEEKNNQ